MPSVLPSTPAMITAVKPTIIDTRAPKIKRDSTSRPMWSGPSRGSLLPPAIQAGGRERWGSEPISGLWGAITSAKIASSARVTRITIGIHGQPSVRSRGSRSVMGAATGLGGAGAGLTLIADPRVDDGVEDVDHQVDDDDHGARPQYRGPHPRGVPEPEGPRHGA